MLYWLLKLLDVCKGQTKNNTIVRPHVCRLTSYKRVLFHPLEVRTQYAKYGSGDSPILALTTGGAI